MMASYSFAQRSNGICRPKDRFPSVGPARAIAAPSCPERSEEEVEMRLPASEPFCKAEQKLARSQLQASFD